MPYQLGSKYTSLAQVIYVGQYRQSEVLVVSRSSPNACTVQVSRLAMMNQSNFNSHRTMGKLPASIPKHSGLLLISSRRWTLHKRLAFRHKYLTQSSVWAQDATFKSTSASDEHEESSVQNTSTGFLGAECQGSLGGRAKIAFSLTPSFFLSLNQLHRLSANDVYSIPPALLLLCK